MPEKNYYEILEIERTATAGQIKSAYLRLALKWHPDKNLNNRDEAERKFKEIGEAYSVFSDPIKKNEYDSFAATENFNYDFNDDFDTRDLFERELGKWSVFGTNEGTINSESGATFDFDNSTREYKEAKRKIIESIKQKPSEWKIEEFLTSNSWADVLLVHRDFGFYYNERGYLVVEYGKIHWQKGFTDEEWNEIKQVIEATQASQHISDSDRLVEIGERGTGSPSQISTRISSTPETERLMREHRKREARRKLKEYKDGKHECFMIINPGGKKCCFLL